LQRLTFGYNFNQIIGIGVLPKNLLSLIFNFKFNEPIGLNVLPENLKYLIFGDSFCQEIDVGVLPDSLNYVEFGFFFVNRLEKEVLPKYLIKLVVGESCIRHLLSNDNLTFDIEYCVVPKNFIKRRNDIYRSIGVNVNSLNL